MAKVLLLTSFTLWLTCVLQASPGLCGEATFNLTNKARFSVMVKVFAKDRHWTWPGSTRHWSLNDSAKHSFHVACQNGERVCYGGAYRANNRTYWGVGFKGDKGCQDCCLTCGDASHSWNLIDQPGSGAPLRPAGQPIDPGSVGIPADD
jgi:hypothetical protein